MHERLHALGREDLRELAVGRGLAEVHALEARALVEAHLDGGGCAVLTSHQSVRIDAGKIISVDLSP